MCQTLFHIPATLFGYPVFGFGLLLGLWAAASVITLTVLARRQGFNADTWGYVPILLLVGAIIVWVLPAIGERPAVGPSPGLPIRGFGMMNLLAVVCGTLLAAWRAKRVGVNPDLVFTLIFWMLIPGIIGARAFYVIEYWRRDYWPSYAGEGGSLATLLRNVVNLTQGGLVLYGSLAGGLLGMLLFVRRYRMPFLAVADLMAPSMLLGLALGRVGCLLNGCCFGAACDHPHPWALEFPAKSPAYMAQAERGQMYGFDIGANDDAKSCLVLKVVPDSRADRAGLKEGERLLRINRHPIDTVGDAHAAILRALLDADPLVVEVEHRSSMTVPAIDPPPRHSLPVQPSQPLSTVDALLLCLLLLAYDPFHRRDGELFALVLSIYPITRFLIEGLRSDEAGRFGTEMSIGQCVSLLALVCAVVLWTYILRQPKGLAFSQRNCQSGSAGR
ncbi:MAG: prolipoprotein diacylglyceryl transferase family protein [Thermoguttaceae bacterium]|jgi:phosphatidylglycerol:prolipoprotein diacylglycerol transferase